MVPHCLTVGQRRYGEAVPIRHDALQVGFKDWVTAYEASLKALEEKRLSEMTAVDLALRTRWRGDRDAMDQADGGE